MKTQTIPQEWILAAGLDLAPQICILEAEAGDSWRGYLIGAKTWRQAGPLPSLPTRTAREAFDEFTKTAKA